MFIQNNYIRTMSKIRISRDAITYDNYFIDCEQSDQPQIECSNKEETLRLSFSSEQYLIYYNGGVAIAYSEENEEIRCKSFSRK